MHKKDYAEPYDLFKLISHNIFALQSIGAIGLFPRYILMMKGVYYLIAIALPTEL
jgi:hypothetical protein